MAFYKCRRCGCEEVAMYDLHKHLRKEHELKKGQEEVIDVRLQDKKGGYKNWKQRYIKIR